MLYLAFLTFRISIAKGNGYNKSKMSFFQLYRCGIIMNITNPRISLFFLSFLPQFADPARGSIVLQLLFLGFVFIISAMLVFGIICTFAGLLGNYLQQSSKSQIVMYRISCIVYVGLAIKLVMAEM